MSEVLLVMSGLWFVWYDAKLRAQQRMSWKNGTEKQTEYIKYISSFV